MLKIIWSRGISVFLAMALTALLAACGGGGSGNTVSGGGSGVGGTTTTPPIASTPTLVLTGSTNAVSATTPAVLTAVLKNGSGTVLPGVVVTFATASTNFGSFFPSGGTALTDSNGIASITLNPGTTSGADSVTATAPVNGVTVTSNAFGYTSTGTTSAARVTLTSSNSTISSNSPATLSATVRDSSGTLVIGALVRFATQSTGFATFSPAGATALTDATGVARISLLAGTQFGADTVTATATVSGVSVTSVPLGFTASGSASVARLSLATSSNSISSSSPATLTATLVDASNTGLPNVVVTFATQGTGYGTFFPSGGTALTNAAGVATISLNAGQAIGADTVTASATVNAVTVTSSPVGYTVSAAPVTSTAASISFTSATPTTVAIRGTGGQENSAVVFTVRDSNGNALANQSVTFSLTSTAGGLSLASSTGVSSASGIVSAILQAGTTATPVRVRAVLTSNPTINTVSSQLVVSTALPHQNGFTIAASKLNVEALSVDGVQTVITARLSDRYGNLVPDGTAVSFRTEGGVAGITPSCVTAGGSCQVTLTSSGRRPRDGRLTVLATAIGEESFVDLNGNGLYDVGEPFTDLPEAFIDGNEDGVRGINTSELTAPLEEFVDFNNNGTYDGADGAFNGVLRACQSITPTPTGCPATAASSTINVRSSVVIVFSGGAALISGVPSPIVLPSCSNGNNAAPQQNYTLRVGDANGNSLAGGTTIALSATNGTIVTPTNIVLPDSNAALPYAFTLGMRSDATFANGVCSNTSTTGNLTITVTSPGGIVTTLTTVVSD